MQLQNFRFFHALIMYSIDSWVAVSNGQSVTNWRSLQMASMVDVKSVSVDNEAKVTFERISGFDLCRAWASFKCCLISTLTSC